MKASKLCGMKASELQTMSIGLAERSYHIAIRGSLFDNPLTYAELPKASAALIVTNTTECPLYAQPLQKGLAPQYGQVHTVVLPDGEEFKTWESLNLIFDALLSHGCDRETAHFSVDTGRPSVASLVNMIQMQLEMAGIATHSDGARGILVQKQDTAMLS